LFSLDGNCPGGTEKSTVRVRMSQLIFVVEPETGARSMAQLCLEEAGYTVRAFSNAKGLDEAEEKLPSLMLIAVGPPDSYSLDLCRRVRQSSKLAGMPIVSLITGTHEEDRIQALDSGADDCISKPFSPRELVARVQAVFRRLARPAASPFRDQTDLVIDTSAMRLSVRGDDIAATTLEFRFVDYIARHRGKVFTRDLLLDAVWGDTQFVTPRSVDACVRRIREKIEPDRSSPTYLKTIRGVGYRFDAVATWHPTSNESCSCVACTASVGHSNLVRGLPRRGASAHR
jgi:two-component system phosphate regulon response regulator PhoB